MKVFPGGINARRAAMWTAAAACAFATVMAVPTVIALAEHPAFSVMSVLRVCVGGFVALASCAVLFWLLYRSPRRRIDPAVLEEVMRLERDSAQRIADQLHDTAVQSLVVATFMAREGASDREAVDTLTDQLRTVEREVRDIIFRTREPAIEGQDLGQCADHLTSLLDLRDGLRIHWQWPTTPDTCLPSAPAVLAYRFLDETLSNVAQHAGTSDAYVTLTVRDDELVVAVRDEGTGFSPDDSARRARSTGMQLLAVRATFVDASVDITSAPGKGTTVTLRCPLPSDASKLIRLGVAPRKVHDDAAPHPAPLLPTQRTIATRRHLAAPAPRPSALEHSQTFRRARTALARATAH